MGKRQRARAEATKRSALRLRTGILTGCLVASGAAALIYEVLWLRELSLVMGHTAYSLSAVLGAFLGGLALGAFLGGRWTARHGASLRLYAVLEIGIAVAALAMPLLVRAVSPVFGVAYRSLVESFVAYNVVQSLGCGLVLLIPTTIMGATLPIVTALVLRSDDEIATGAGKLYGANSIGGAIGAGLCGFFLLPGLGMIGAGLVAVGLNLLVAAAAFWLSRQDEPISSSVGPAPPGEAAPTALPAKAWPAPPLAVIALLYGISGFAALAFEVGWARVVTLSIGSTTHGFTIILVTYIVGLAAGSWLIPRFRVATKDPVRALFVLHAAIAVISLVSLPVLGTLPVRVVKLLGGGDISRTSMLWGELFLVGVTIIGPTVAMGGAFPLVARLLHAGEGTSGRAIGTTYAANTIGNILGSVIAGFVLVPWIGMRATIVLAAILVSLVALGYLIAAVRARPKALIIRAATLAVLVASCAWIAPGWDREVLTSGAYLYGGRLMSLSRQYTGSDAIEQAMRGRFEMIDYREGATAVVTVKRATVGGSLHLQVSGKSDAFSYASTQNLIAHAPLLLHGSATEVLVVGLGSGSTLGSVLRHPVDRVDCIEISAEVRDAAREYFSEFTENALDDPRANVRIGDGRNHLRHSESTYDVIISQPSNPWMSGAAGLFTREYFEDVRRRLKPGGVACSWFKFAATDGAATKAVLASWHEVFPDAYLFETRAFGELMLIGFTRPTDLSAFLVTQGLARAEVLDDLSKINIRDTRDLLSLLALSPEEVRSYTEGAVVNTDVNGFIEFQGPRLLDLSQKSRLYGEIAELRPRLLDVVDVEMPSARDRDTLVDTLTAATEAKQLVHRAMVEYQRGGATVEWKRLVNEAARLHRRDAYVQQHLPLASQ